MTAAIPQMGMVLLSQAGPQSHSWPLVGFESIAAVVGTHSFTYALAPEHTSACSKRGRMLSYPSFLVMWPTWPTTYSVASIV